MKIRSEYYSVHNVNIVVLNVNGLNKDKLHDTEFTSIICKGDIVILTETWLDERVNIETDRFYNYHYLRPKNVRAVRASGGISVLVNKSYRKDAGSNKSKGVSFMDENNFCVWLKLSSLFFKIPRDIYLGGVYIPPEYSTFYQNNPDDPYTLLENDVIKYGSLGDIIITGDFNARTGELHDYLEVQDSTIHNNIPIASTSHALLDKLGRTGRNNRDSKINVYGRLMLDLCKNADLIIVNGRTIGDVSGAFTCYKENGKSLVDYLICSASLFKTFSYLSISQPLLISDHAALCARLELPNTFINQLDESKSQHKINETKTFVWDSTSDTKFREALCFPNVSQSITTVLNNKPDNSQEAIDKYCQNINNIYQDTARISLKYKSNSKTLRKGPRDKLGFDGDCRKAKNEALHLSKLVKKYPGNPHIYGQFVKTKKYFKKLVKQKHRMAKTNLLNTIAKMESSNPEEFWKMLKKLKNGKLSEESPIPLTTWQGYFTDLHNEPISKNINEQTAEKIKHGITALKVNAKAVPILDSIITNKELTESIRSLKSRKACGPDLIRNEFIKLSCHDLTECIRTLFNAIIESGKVPMSWSLGYISPIFKGGDASEPKNYRGISITSCMGKLFASIMSKRLVTYMETEKLLDPSQIGFVKNKRTADHIFVLKAIIEEAKSKRIPIYGCFVDLRKAFDTVWRTGLYYKMLQNFRVSPKFVTIIESMYANLKGQAKILGLLSDTFDISIGLRQGCNLSPQLFNAYINDLPNLLKRAECDPVTLNGLKVNILSYADDMLILSKSPQGLQKSLNILQIYCEKWQLVVNENKTKIMIFNKIKHDSRFSFGDKEIDIVDQHTYLGIRLHRSGSFTTAIKDLILRATKAYFGVRSMIKDCNTSPRLHMKIFDSTVKPILTYCSEVWGIFGLKSCKQESLLLELLRNDKHPVEKLNLKMCKQCLLTPRRTSNIGCKAELGRYPIMKCIITTILKNYVRIANSHEDELLAKALESQKSLRSNSLNTLTYNQAIDALLEQLHLENDSHIIIPTHNHKAKYKINAFGKKVSKACKMEYDQYILTTLSSYRNDKNSRLWLYSLLKKDFKYEKYLDETCHNRQELTKFRLSLHWLPIERLRYNKTKIDRKLRICPLCKGNNIIGDEIHALMYCQNTEISELRTSMVEHAKLITPLCGLELYLFLLSGPPPIILKICIWLREINAQYKMRIIQPGIP